MNNYTGQYWSWPQNEYGNWFRQITIEEAMHIALQQVPGQIVKVELEMEHGSRIYEVDIINQQGVKYEVKVDVNTGRIINVELD